MFVIRTTVLLLLIAAFAPAQVDESLQKQINASIDKGVVWLKARQVQDGPFKGSFGDAENYAYEGGSAQVKGKMYLATTALSLLTLLKCGVDPEDACVTGGLAWLEKQMKKEYAEVKKGAPDAAALGNTYEGGILLMMYEALSTARKKKKGSEDLKPELADGEMRTVERIAKWLKDTQSRKGGWRYGAPAFSSPGGIDEDPSATQIVTLGLASAVRLGIEVSPEVWMRAAEWVLEAQEKTGPAAKAKKEQAQEGTYAVREGDRARGWPYLRRGDEDETKTTGSLTACAIGSLILAKAHLRETKSWTKTVAAAVDRGIYDGIAWIDLNYTVDGNPKGFRSHFYYLYGLERLGTLGGFRRVGARDWYADGASFLVQDQEDAGFWNTGTEIEPCDLIDTCFALLFLKKATVPVGVTLTR